MEHTIAEVQKQAAKTEGNIRDLLELVPELLRQKVLEFCSSDTLRYGGTIPKQCEAGSHPYIEWGANLALALDTHNWTPLQHTTSTRILFYISYFGGGMNYNPAESVALYLAMPNQLRGRSASYVIVQPDDIFRGLPKYFPEDVIPNLLEAVAVTIPVFEKTLSDFIYKETSSTLGNDALFLLRQASRWQQFQRHTLKTEDAYRDIIQEARTELPGIIDGLRNSKSFAKSPTLKNLRERAEKLLEMLSQITTLEFYKKIHGD